MPIGSTARKIDEYQPKRTVQRNKDADPRPVGRQAYNRSGALLYRAEPTRGTTAKLTRPVAKSAPIKTAKNTVKNTTKGTAQNYTKNTRNTNTRNSYAKGSITKSSNVKNHAKYIKPAASATRKPQPKRAASRRTKPAPKTNGFAVVLFSLILIGTLIIIGIGFTSLFKPNIMDGGTTPPNATDKPPSAVQPTSDPYGEEVPTGALPPLVIEENIPIEGFQEAQVGVFSDNYALIDTLTIDLSSSIPLLVNASHRLSEEYVPSGLVDLATYCPPAVVRIKGEGMQGVDVAVDALLEMFGAAIDEGIADWQISGGYRTWSYQQTVFNQRLAAYEKGEDMTRAKAIAMTRRYVAEPGASEHHTGLAFDITVPGKVFAETEQCAWLAKHCYEYGFVVRYTSDKVETTGIAAEPWHIRYVGIEAAQAMQANNWCLEEYVAAMGG